MWVNQIETTRRRVVSCGTILSTGLEKAARDFHIEKVLVIDEQIDSFKYLLDSLLAPLSPV